MTSEVGSERGPSKAGFRSGFQRGTSRLGRMLRTVLGLQHSAAGQGGQRRSVLRELLDEAAAIVAFEVNEGCVPEVDAKVEALRGRIFTAEVAYSGAGADEAALDELWVALLRLGLFDELIYLVNRWKLPLRAGIMPLLEYCKLEFQRCLSSGQTYRGRHPAGEVFTMGCIVWGEQYIGNFLRFNVRSMLSPNNIPALAAQGRVVFSIVTDEAGRQRLAGDPIFARLAEIVDVEYTIIPDALIEVLRRGHHVRNFYILYGLLDHCSIFFAQGAGSHLFMIPVDCVVADGSLVAMANYRHEGYECCGGGNIVANTEELLPALEARYGDGPITISTEELATLAAQHAHHYFLSQIIAAENRDFGRHPRELFWPVTGGVEIHSVFIHPLFTTASALARYDRKHLANIDYGMMPRLFLNADTIKILDDAGRAYVNNFTARDRLYETTGRPFTVDDFLRCHDQTYPVQKSLFARAQFLPCRLAGWTSCSDVGQDVREISAGLGIESRTANAVELR